MYTGIIISQNRLMIRDQESVAKIELYGLLLHVPMQFKKATVIMEAQGSFNEMVQGIET